MSARAAASGAAAAAAPAPISGRRLSLLRAQWYLIRARLSVRLTPRGRLLAEPPARMGVGGAESTAMGIWRAQHAARAIDRAARFWPVAPTCLVRTIALERLLHHDGVAGAVVRIGVRVVADRPQMHAWLEIDGVAIGEPAEVTATFTPLHDFTAARDA
jgi:Transglutaminase-like superfamily